MKKLSALQAMQMADRFDRYMRHRVFWYIDPWRIWNFSRYIRFGAGISGMALRVMDKRKEMPMKP